MIAFRDVTFLHDRHPANLLPDVVLDRSRLLFESRSADNDVLKGKVAELRLELNVGGKKDKNYSAKKVALKKIVANMTMSNNDMVALFPDVVGCMQLPSLEIKKMCAGFHGLISQQIR